MNMVEMGKMASKSDENGDESDRKNKKRTHHRHF